MTEVEPIIQTIQPTTTNSTMAAGVAAFLHGLAQETRAVKASTRQSMVALGYIDWLESSIERECKYQGFKWKGLLEAGSSSRSWIRWYMNLKSTDFITKSYIKKWYTKSREAEKRAAVKEERKNRYTTDEYKVLMDYTFDFGKRQGLTMKHIIINHPDYVEYLIRDSDKFDARERLGLDTLVKTMHMAQPPPKKRRKKKVAIVKRATTTGKKKRVKAKGKRKRRSASHSDDTEEDDVNMATPATPIKPPKVSMNGKTPIGRRKRGAPQPAVQITVDMDDEEDEDIDEVVDTGESAYVPEADDDEDEDDDELEDADDH